jgi:hypothetical protein
VARLALEEVTEEMQKRRFLMTGLLLVLICAVVAAAGVGICHLTKKQEEHSGFVGFFYDNRRLFEDIKDDFMALDGFLDPGGYVANYDAQSNREQRWYPGLSENAVYYYEIMPYPEPLIYCRDFSGRDFYGQDYSGVKQLRFESRDFRGGFVEGIVYCEIRLPEGTYTKIEGNWYYYWEGMI